MSNPSLICVDVEGHLKDNPPQDAELSPSLLSYVSKKIAEVYDYTSIYDKVDSLACQILRDLKDQGRIRYEVVVLDYNNNWKTLHTYTRYCDADRRVDVYTDIHPHAVCDIREVLVEEQD